MRLRIRRIRTHAERLQAHALVTALEPGERAMHYPFTDRAHTAGHVMWGAFDEHNQLQAACTAYMEGKTHLHLTMCFVRPAARGHNLQRRLIRARLAYGRKHRAILAQTYTHTRNHASMCNLLREGFVPYQLTGHGEYLSFAKRL